MVSATFKADIPCSAKHFWKDLSRHTQWCVSMVLLNPIKLPIFHLIHLSLFLCLSLMLPFLSLYIPKTCVFVFFPNRHLGFALDYWVFAIFFIPFEVLFQPHKWLMDVV